MVINIVYTGIKDLYKIDIKSNISITYNNIPIKQIGRYIDDYINEYYKHTTKK